MANGGGPAQVRVLRIDAIRWAIDTLTARRVHPFFIAYLHIRSKGREAGSTLRISPRWAELGNYLAVPGGPPGKPYYRPFLADRVHDRSRYWMNENLAGSWAPSSLREGQAPLEVVERVGQYYSLKENHALLAGRHLLFDQRMLVVALATYLYRDYGFVEKEREIHPADVIATFAWDFDFPGVRVDPTARILIDPQAGVDFVTLFDTAIPEGPGVWFEEFPAGSEEVLR